VIEEILKKEAEPMMMRRLKISSVANRRSYAGPSR
jgi:hypothetical protein